MLHGITSSFANAIIVKKGETFSPPLEKPPYRSTCAENIKVRGMDIPKVLEPPRPIQ